MGEHRWKNDYSANDRLGWSTLADFAQDRLRGIEGIIEWNGKMRRGKKMVGKVQEENWKEGRTWEIGTRWLQLAWLDDSLTRDVPVRKCLGLIRKLLKGKYFGGRSVYSVYTGYIHSWPTNVLLLTNNGAYIRPFHSEFEQRGPRIFGTSHRKIACRRKYSGNMLITS